MYSMCEEGHSSTKCTFLKENHLDVNNDPKTSFHESKAGLNYIRKTGRPTLNHAFNSTTYNASFSFNKHKDSKRSKLNEVSAIQSTKAASP